MRFTHIARALGLAAVLALPAVALADEKVELLRLTSTGQILNGTGSVVHTDANIRFIHTARHTVYKVLKDGSIYGARFCNSAVSTGWTFLGKDAAITSRVQLTGGDNGFTGGCSVAPYADTNNLDPGYNAPLFRVAGTTISRWSGSGANWTFAATGFGISGSYKTASSTVWQGFAPNAAPFSPAGETIIQLSHRGGWFDKVFYTVNAGAKKVTLKRNGTVLANLNTGFYVDSLSSEGWNGVFTIAFDDPELGHADEIKQVVLFKGSAGTTTPLFTDFVKDVRVGEGDDHGPEVYSLLDNGVGTVRRHYCGTSPCSTALIQPPAGKVVTQIAVVQTTYQP